MAMIRMARKYKLVGIFDKVRIMAILTNIFLVIGIAKAANSNEVNLFVADSDTILGNFGAVIGLGKADDGKSFAKAEDGSSIANVSASMFLETFEPLKSILQIGHDVIAGLSLHCSQKAWPLEH